VTPKQKKFCEYYIQSGNATDAARKAGYSEKTARAIGNENLTKPDIQAYIHERVGDQDKNLVADADEVLRFYSAVMRGEVKDQFGLDASLSDRLKAGDSLMKRYAAGGSKKNETEDDPITKSLKEDKAHGLL
jgi:phage terminase small subunit